MHNISFVATKNYKERNITNDKLNEKYLKNL